MSNSKQNRSINRNKLAYGRIVVKAGTNVITSTDGSLDPNIMNELVKQIVQVRSLGAEVILVTSGATSAGREALGEQISGKAVPELQQLAAVGQSRLMHQYQAFFSSYHTTIAQALLTKRDVDERQGYLNIRNTLDGLIKRGVVPVINENDVVNVEELGQDGFGDNDQLSALVANLVDADLLILLTSTGGLYTADPGRDPSAKLIDRVDSVDESILAMAEIHRGTNSRGGMRSKLEAARLATSYGVTVIITDASKPDRLQKLIEGYSFGTFFPTTVSRMESRKRWLLSGLAPGSGTVVIDEGAIKALRERTSSLLPAGINDVKGQFARGDVVLIARSNGEQIAYGISNYSDTDVKALRGIKSNRIFEKLGHRFGDEVVHRNNMVVL